MLINRAISGMDEEETVYEPLSKIQLWPSSKVAVRDKSEKA